MNHEACHLPGSDTCHENSEQFMINAFMMQHQHHDQFGTGSYQIDYQPATAAAAAAACSNANVPGCTRLQSHADHHYGAHLNTVSAGLLSSSSAAAAGAFHILGGSIGGLAGGIPVGPALAGGIPAGPALSGASIMAYGGNPSRITTPGTGIPPASQNGGIHGGGGISRHANGMATSTGAVPTPPSRYESQKRRDWNTFGQYLRNSRPPLPLARCNGDHVLQFLRYLDQFGKTKVHGPRCSYYGLPHPPGPCECPLRQAWGSLDALIGRLRAAFEEHGGKPESNPFGARPVRIYLREVRDLQAKARGIAYEKKKRKHPKPPMGACSSSTDTNMKFGSEPPAGSSSSSGSLMSGCN